LNVSQWTPIFPLPNAVLLPRAVLPLHVFEERYKSMTRDALRGSRRIALALLRPGFEARYHTLDAPIHDVVCVGRILREECLPDGRFNFLLQGLFRARVIEENHQRRYRRARLRLVPDRDVEPQEECLIRRKLKAFMLESPIAQLAECGNWHALMKCSDMSLSNIVDVLASIVLQSPAEKQFFLAESRLCARAHHLIDALQGTAAALCNHARQAQLARSWPRSVYRN